MHLETRSNLRLGVPSPLQVCGECMSVPVQVRFQSVAAVLEKDGFDDFGTVIDDVALPLE